MNIQEQILDENEYHKKIDKLKGRDVLVEYPKYRDYIKNKYGNEIRENQLKMNEIIENMDFFDFIDQMKSHRNDLSKVEFDNLINNTLLYISQVFDINFDEEKIKRRNDTERILNYSIESERLSQIFELFKNIQERESKNSGKTECIGTFKLYYQLKRTFIYMKEMGKMNEEEFLNYINTKMGFSLDNFLKIKDYIKSPTQQNLDREDKEDVLGFFSTYGLISKNFKNSKEYQNKFFQSIEENSRKRQIIQRLQRKMEEKKKIKSNDENILESINDIDKQLNDLELNIDSSFDLNELNNENSENLENSENSFSENQTKKEKKNKNKNKKNKKNKRR